MAKAGHVDGRVDHVGGPAVGPPDAVRDEARDGHEVVDAGRGAPIPAPERGGDGGHGRAHRPARARAEVLVVEIPDVAHRREAVAHVQRARGHGDRLGHRVARGQHEVVAAEIEAADGGGKQRQVPAVPGRRAGQPLDERGDDAAPLDDGGDGARHVDQREEVGLGEQLAEHLETALAAAHSREPVVDQRHSHGVDPISARRAGPAPASSRGAR